VSAALRAQLLLACLVAGCAQILGIDQEYREGSDDAGSAPEDAGVGPPEDTGAELDATPEDSGPAGFDCGMLEGLLVSGHCYFVIAAGSGLIWTRAATTCESFSGSHLATITSAAEQEAIEGAFFPSTTDYWIGLSLQGASSATPPASCKTNPGSCPFLWITGEPLSYTKWSRRSATDVEPNFTGGCARLQLTDRSWADLGCGAQVPALCEHD
jgi:hypothetical protein